MNVTTGSEPLLLELDLTHREIRQPFSNASTMEELCQR
jgi:hypothetical protein